MIPGAIDDSTLLHVRTSYLTRYSADEFSALIVFPLFLITVSLPSSRFSRPFSASSRCHPQSRVSSLLFFRELRSRGYCSRRRRLSLPLLIPGNTTALMFQETGRHFHRGSVHNETDPAVSPRIEDRRSTIPIVKSARALFLLRHGRTASLLSHCVEKCRLDVPRRGRKVAKIT